MPKLKCPQCGRGVTNPEILKNPALLRKPSGLPDPALDLCTTCWEDLPRVRVSVAESPKVRLSPITGNFLFVRAGEEKETADYPIPLLSRKKRGQESPAETPPETRWPEFVAQAERWARQRPWELRIRGGYCRLVRARLLAGVARDLAHEAGVYPVVWENVGPVVSMHRKHVLQRFLPPGLSLKTIPEDRAKPGRRFGKPVADPRFPGRRETTPSEWEQDRNQYYHLRRLAYDLQGKPEGQQAAEAALLARLELSRKYKGARQCHMCPNLIPRLSKARYCKPACKERAKNRRK